MLKLHHEKKVLSWNIEIRSYHPLCYVSQGGFKSTCLDILLTNSYPVSLSFFLVSHVLKGKQMVPVLNAMGIHCAVYGNHEFGRLLFYYYHLLTLGLPKSQNAPVY